MSRKNTPPSYTEPGGPRMVETHSKRLSPLGPALQLGGGSNEIPPSSFWIRLAEVVSAFDIFGVPVLLSFLDFSGVSALEPASDILPSICLKIQKLISLLVKNHHCIARFLLETG